MLLLSFFFLKSMATYFCPEREENAENKCDVSCLIFLTRCCILSSYFFLLECKIFAGKLRGYFWNVPDCVNCSVPWKCHRYIGITHQWDQLFKTHTLNQSNTGLPEPRLIPSFIPCMLGALCQTFIQTWPLELHACTLDQSGLLHTCIPWIASSENWMALFSWSVSCTLNEVWLYNTLSLHLKRRPDL